MFYLNYFYKARRCCLFQPRRQTSSSHIGQSTASCFGILIRSFISRCHCLLFIDWHEYIFLQSSIAWSDLNFAIFRATTCPFIYPNVDWKIYLNNWCIIFMSLESSVTHIIHLIFFSYYRVVDFIQLPSVISTHVMFYIFAILFIIIIPFPLSHRYYKAWDKINQYDEHNIWNAEVCKPLFALWNWKTFIKAFTLEGHRKEIIAYTIAIRGKSSSDSSLDSSSSTQYQRHWCYWYQRPFTSSASIALNQLWVVLKRLVSPLLHRTVERNDIFDSTVFIKPSLLVNRSTNTYNVQNKVSTISDDVLAPSTYENRADLWT